MTRARQKDLERFYAKQAALELGKQWDLGTNRESPDFIVTEGSERFGLEVQQLFTGLQGKCGSRRKTTENNNQRCLNALQAEFEKTTNTPIQVKFLGDLSKEHLEQAYSQFLRAGYKDMLPGCRDVFEVHGGPRGLKVFVTRVTDNTRREWFCVSDHVGWVEQNAIERTQKAIREKASKLGRYKEDAVSDDIRLLLVADHLRKSGMLTLDRGAKLDLCGFRVVYFYHYPEQVTPFGGS